MITTADDKIGLSDRITFDVLCMIWVIVAPWLLLLILNLVDGFDSEESFTALLEVFGASVLVAFFGGIVGGLAGRDRKGRRRWYVSLTTFLVPLVYFAIFLSNIRHI